MVMNSIRLSICLSIIACKYTSVAILFIYVIEIYRGMFFIGNELVVFFIVHLQTVSKELHCIMIFGEKSMSACLKEADHPAS